MTLSRCKKDCQYLAGSLPSVRDFDWLKEIYVPKGYLTSEIFNRSQKISKSGKLKDVYEKAQFFTDGYFDFEDSVWKSSNELIENSRWYVPSISEYFRTYPALNDRIAFIKEWFQSYLDLTHIICGK